MALIIVSIVGALAILAASVVGLLVAAEDEARDRIKDAPENGKFI